MDLTSRCDLQRLNLTSRGQIWRLNGLKLQFDFFVLSSTIQPLICCGMVSNKVEFNLQKVEFDLLTSTYTNVVRLGRPKSQADQRMRFSKDLLNALKMIIFALEKWWKTRYNWQGSITGHPIKRKMCWVDIFIIFQSRPTINVYL